jgi:hypothetical protein
VTFKANAPEWISLPLGRMLGQRFVPYPIGLSLKSK